MSTPQRPSGLRPFQERVFDSVMQGESILLQAPTGAGKTRAALAPFLQNLADCSAAPEREPLLPLTCRYAVPLRVLASQFFKEYHDYAARIDRYLASNLVSTYQEFGQEAVSIQTGDQPADPELASALTFCTIDQLLASFIGIPYGLGKRRANLNVGAVLGAYQVLDEFHLYPLSRDGRGLLGARTTALQMLRMQQIGSTRLAPFVLMTATFSSHLLGQLAQLLQATPIHITPDEIAELNMERERRYIVHSTPMESGFILDQHDGCSLVICNTVRRAQHLFLELRARARRERPDTTVILLHSRFTDTDRSRIQQLLAAELGKGSWKGGRYHGRDLIVVATQVVEVGMDMSARTLHSEAAPASSIIQRAGRCARFEHQQGHVHLYPLAEDQTWLPYNRAQSEATLRAFASLEGQPAGFPEEQRVIDAVHTDEDRALLENFERDHSIIRGKIYQGWRDTERGVASELIRDVQQVPLLIHSDPNAAICERPWEWQTFSLRPGSLIGSWSALAEAHAAAQTLDNEQPAMIWKAVLADAAQETEENERLPTRYSWTPLAHPAEIRTALMLALAPTVATYDADLGLVLNDGKLPFDWPAQPFQSEHQEQGRRQRPSFDYDQESYAEHIGGLLGAYRHSRLKQDMRFVAQRLEQALGLPPGAVDRAVRLAIACHDIGKLGAGWQGWARGWQEHLCQQFPAEAEHYRPQKYPFAHTDLIQRKHGQLSRVFSRSLRRPPHACESAYLALPLLLDVLGRDEPGRMQARVIAAAIARHHSPGSVAYTAISLVPEAHAQVRAMLELVRQGERWSYDIAHLGSAVLHESELTDKHITMPRVEREAETLLYFVVVRALRLADMRSFYFKSEREV